MTIRNGAIPGPALFRAGQLLATGGRMAARALQAPELVTALSRLKGAALKAGQMLSIELGDILPPEATAVLRQLQGPGDTMQLDQVRWILRCELGADVAGALTDLSAEPIGNASIAQVHSARLDGRPVAVKVQLPGVGESFESDLRVLRDLAAAYVRIQGLAVDVGAFFDDLAAGLRQELDFQSEARRLASYGERLHGPAFVVPRVEADLVTSRVLVMSHEKGQSIGDWLDSRADARQTARLAELLLELVVTEIFGIGLVQSDPDLGNFLYRPREERLVLLDCGSVVELSLARRRELASLLEVLLTGTDDEMLTLVHAYEYVDPREAAGTKTELLALIRRIREVFDPTRRPRRLGDVEWLDDFRKTAFKVATGVRRSSPAADLTLVLRKVSGIFHLLKELDAVVDLSTLGARIRKAVG